MKPSPLSDACRLHIVALQHEGRTEPTKLPNRLVFQKRLAVALVYADRTGLPVGLMLLDLDCFKSVNDTLGHSVGDALLCEVASRILKCVRATDTVARLGGDEFAVVAPNLKNLFDIDCLASRIVASLAEPFNLD
ncbi:MAG TPA: diguanylate cyclase, partial [Phycisphaerae bacterium]|nr:diguanylate cyclase [Phycisphaerae bacterium]